MFQMVHGTNGLHVGGTNSQWYEITNSLVIQLQNRNKSRHTFDVG